MMLRTIDFWRVPKDDLVVVKARGLRDERSKEVPRALPAAPAGTWSLREAPTRWLAVRHQGHQRGDGREPAGQRSRRDRRPQAKTKNSGEDNRRRSPLPERTAGKAISILGVGVAYVSVSLDRAIGPFGPRHLPRA